MGPLEASGLKYATEMAWHEPASQQTSHASQMEGRLHPAALATFLGGQGFDLGTTLSALSHGAQEANPVLGQHPGRVSAIKALSMLAQWLIYRELAEEHPKLANGLAIGSGALGAGAGAYNMRQMAK